MKSFEYNGYSTTNIVDKPLMIAQFDRETDLDGFHREIIKGEKTLLRQEQNHYGAMYNDKSYEFALVKKDGSPFSYDEHRLINKWLTSPKLVKPLTGITDDDETVVYRGIFSSVGWKMITGNFDGVICTFESDLPFAWKRETKTITSSGSTTATIDIQSDDSEYIVYPKIKITSSTKQTIRITNNSDDSNSISVSVNANLPVTINCKYCMVTDATTNGIIDFEDLGWTDASKIYFPKLYDGGNSITVSGSCTVVFEYEYPIKRVGDFV